MNRIQISSAASSSPVNFTMGVNPVTYDAADEPRLNKFDVLHGANIWQNEPNDYYTRIMRWENMPSNDVSFMNLVTYFRSIEGQTRYINFRDINVLNSRWVTDTSTSWKKCQIITTKSALRPGGRLVFDYFEVHCRSKD